MATSLEESEKLDLIKKIHAKTFHFGKKNRENRSSRSRDSFAHIKKRKKLRKVKYIALPASLPSGLNYLHSSPTVTIFNRKRQRFVSIFAVSIPRAFYRRTLASDTFMTPPYGGA